LKRFTDYQEAETAAVLLCFQEKHGEAVELLKNLLGQYPEKLHDIAWGLVFNYCMSGQYEKALDMSESALKKGIFFPFHMEFDFWKPLERFERFKGIREENERLRKQARAEAKPQFEILKPRNYSKKETYPLFIVLHGWGDDNKMLMRYWKSEKLEKEYLVAFLQSSRVVRTGGYAWDDLPLARKEIKQMVEQIVKEYPVDPDKTIMGGFSQGGKMTLDIIFTQTIPLKGFVAVCPGGGIPEALTVENAAKAAEKNVQGSIITGDRDESLPEQQETVKILKEAGFPYRFIVNPGMYHWFPEDFGNQLDLAIDHINI
jgi:predicted esterase